MTPKINIRFNEESFTVSIHIELEQALYHCFSQSALADIIGEAQKQLLDKIVEKLEPKVEPEVMANLDVQTITNLATISFAKRMADKVEKL